MNVDYGWECDECGAWGRGTQMEHFQDCVLLLFREWIGDVATILIEGGNQLPPSQQTKESA